MKNIKQSAKLVKLDPLGRSFDAVNDDVQDKITGCTGRSLLDLQAKSSLWKANSVQDQSGAVGNSCC